MRSADKLRLGAVHNKGSKQHNSTATATYWVQARTTFQLRRHHAKESRMRTLAMLGDNVTVLCCVCKRREALTVSSGTGSDAAVGGRGGG